MPNDNLSREPIRGTDARLEKHPTSERRRDKGFEELCAQLARAESPADSEFVRKGTPDAGVECYAILSDSNEWGWQSKYFNGLAEAQWSQLDESIETALEKHPRLIRYFVCVPVDRSDARVPRRRSEMDRWRDHEAKWRTWASDRGMTVEFVDWGSHELIERLSQAGTYGKTPFLVRCPGLDGAWFSARLEEALRTAGPRSHPRSTSTFRSHANLRRFGGLLASSSARRAGLARFAKKCGGSTTRLGQTTIRPVRRHPSCQRRFGPFSLLSAA